jgi:threonyl-tRNA synthetase
MMSETSEKKALIVLGCPEVPVQNALAVYTAYQLKTRGFSHLIAGNPAVMKLLMTSDPERHYIGKMTTLEKAVEDITSGDNNYGLCIAFAHSDAGISYAATMKYLLPSARFVTVVFGREAESVSQLIEYDGELVIEVAVHNPMQLKRKMGMVLGWDASKN